MHKPPPLKSLTGLRFLAAAYVVVYHLWRYEVWDAPIWLLRIITAGPIAVTLFFVLSGFILVYNYTPDNDDLFRGNRVSKGSLTRSASSFWRARFARIYPVYALGLLLSFLPAWILAQRANISSGVFFAKGVSAFLLLQSQWPTWSLAWNPPAWSISVEAFFYLIFPFIAPYFLRSSLKKNLYIALTLFAFSLLLSVGYVYFDPDQLGRSVTYQDHIFWWEALKYHPMVRLPEFILGMIAGRFFGVQNTFKGCAFHSFIINPYLIWVMLLSLLMSVALGLFQVALHNALFAPVFALLILHLSLSSSSSSSSSMFLWLGSPLMQKLGEGSYALYVLHVPVFYWIGGIGERKTGCKILENPVIAILSFLFTIIVSLFVFKFIESPLRKKLRGSC